jgi:hypothetical protein
VNRTVKKIQCKVVRSVPLTHKTCEDGQRKRANRQSKESQRGEAVATSLSVPRLLEDFVLRNDTAGQVESDFDESFGWHKFAEEAAQGQFLDVWA